MAKLREITNALASSILAGMTTDTGDDDAVFVYADIPDVQQSPAIVIQPAPRDTGNFQGAFRRGMYTWKLDVFVMVQRSSYVAAQEVLVKLVDPNEELSVARAIQNDPTLGFEDGTDADLSGVRLYGGAFENANIPHVGAVLSVTVRTSGE